MATTDKRPLGKRLAWFVGLYLLGGGVTMAVAYGLRALLNG